MFKLWVQPSDLTLTIKYHESESESAQELLERVEAMAEEHDMFITEYHDEPLLESYGLILRGTRTHGNWRIEKV